MYHKSFLALSLPLLLALTACGGGGGGGSGSSGVAVKEFAYVANQTSGDVSAYAIDPNTGALTPIDADLNTAGVQNFPAGVAPDSIAVDPLHRFVYVANQTSGDVSAYTVDPNTGALTPIDANPNVAGIQNFLVGTNPVAIAVDPTGSFVYTALSGGSVSAFVIGGSTGALSAVPGSPFATTGLDAGTVTSVTVDPSGRFVYVGGRITFTILGSVMTFTNGGVSAFAIERPSTLLPQPDPNAGALTAIGSQPFDTGLQIEAVSALGVNPLGNFLYTARGIFLQDIGSDGSLSAPGSLVSASAVSAIAFDPVGPFAYGADGLANTVSAYVIDSVTGMPMDIDSDLLTTGVQDFPAGMDPVSVSVEPSGHFVYAADEGSDDVTVYRIGSRGVPTAIAGSPFPAGRGPVSIATTKTM